MAVLQIRYWPDPILKQKGEPITEWDEGLRKLLSDMAETMYANRGIGLAAQQVGIAKLMLVCDVPPEEEGGKGSGLLAITNPRIIWREGEITWKEGCLSFPGLEIEVTRWEKIRVAYQDEYGKYRELEAAGLLAVCLQHEIDHVNGVVFVDRVGPVRRKMALREYERLRKAAQIMDKRSAEP